MGDKVDYRPKKKMNKKIKIVLIVLLVLIVIYFVAQSFIRAYREVVPKTIKETDKSYYSVDDFESLEEILNKYNCTYISEVNSSNLLKIYVGFDRDLYTDNVSNENFFNKLIRLIVVFENYKNIELIDETRDIDILVTCENSSIVEIKINGDINYYLNQDSKLNSKKAETEITKFSVESGILQQLIDNNWNPIGLNFGSKDSSCNGYEIYFDEGFKYKVVGRNVYNLIFTDKYNGKVVGNLNAISSKEEIVASLGDPTFKQDENLYGYLGEYNYVFFDFMNNQVSIYPVLELENESEFIELINSMNESLDIKQFSMDLTSLWTDYDIYNYNSNYVDLQYTLRGIRLIISSTSLKNGIYIYQNYGGDKSNLDGLENTYIQETDLVFDEEKSRMIEEELTTLDQGEFTEEEKAKLGTKFSIRFRGVLGSNEIGYKGPTFYSRDNEYPDTELSKTLVISSYYWYDDYNFVYSVDNDGIYVFNPATNIDTKILDVEGNININSAGNGKIIYNNTEEISIQIN